ncbi:MAG: tRNA epoxyqueuosine(34) reductase QueG [Ilumatobacteraceae bacterium]|nr:tRNA epoxyqueuosine(34) reductase QueG [Ilumatobacteraceae bacterium]
MPSVSPVPKNPKVVSPDAPSGAQYFSQLHHVGLQAGLHEIGVAPAGVMHRALQQLRHREERELTNGMKFTYLRPERSTNPSLLVEGARSVIVGMRSYAYDDPIVVNDGTVRARIARYAWEDHYGILKTSLTAVAAQLRRDGHRATVFADDNSIVDREIAWLAGLGWYGRNANLLVPGKGSMFVIGCVVTTADLPFAEEVPDGCGTCSRCIPACPTNAIVESGVIDANRCLSWLLQKPGIFNAEYREALGDRIYGCDECQVVCPPTKKFGTQPAPETVQSHVNVLALLSLSDTELDAACDRWYVHDRDMTWVRRNLLIVLGNVGQPSHSDTVETLRRYLSHERPELRAHAVWAAARLGLSHLLHTDDPHPMVVTELQNLPPLRGTL